MSLLQAYSYSATCPWTPFSPGTYLLSVTAQDVVTGATANTTLWYIISSGPPLSAVFVTTSLPSPQTAYTPITLSGQATGGTNVQFQFWVYNPADHPGVESAPGLLRPIELYLDPERSRQLPALRHRTRWEHRERSEHDALVYRAVTDHLLFDGR